MHKVEHEILDTTDEPSKVLEESREDYLRRLTVAVAYVDDYAWDSLSEEAKIWANSSIDAMNEEEVPEDFHEFFGTDEETHGISSVEEARHKVEEEKRRAPDQTHNPRRRNRKKPGRKPTKQAKGAARRAKEIFLENPSADKEEILAQLVYEGYQMSMASIIAVRAEFRNSLKVLVDKGYLDGENNYFGF